MINIIAPSIAAGLFALLFLSLEWGFRAGRRAAKRPSASAIAPGQVGAVQGAVLGLLGLLLAFSFAAAGSRFLERQDLITVEANAIGTAFLRADLIEEPHRAELRAALRDYASHRVEVAPQLRVGLSLETMSEFDAFHDRIWLAASRGVQDQPAVALAVLGPVNEVIDLHSTRIAAGKKHLPLPVLGLLIACSVLALGVIGYGSGLGGRRAAPLTVPLVLLVGASLWITIDLDHPRAGVLQLSDAPLKALRFGPPPP